MATGSWSGSVYLKNGVTLTVNNPSKENITSMTFKIVTAAQSGGAYHHSYTIECTSHGGYVQCETDGTGSYTWDLTTTSGFSGTSNSVTFDLSYDNNFITVSSISLSSYTVATVNNNTIYYYLGSDYYTSDTEQSFDTRSSFTLIDVPDDETDPGTYADAFTITGKANTGVKDTSRIAQSKTDITYSYNGWYQGSTSGTYRSPGSIYNLSDGTKLYATVSTSSSVDYRYNTLADLPKPTKESSTTTYTVTFDSNNGTNPTSQQAIKTIPYKFSHWSSTASGGTTYAETQAFTSAKTVYAQWSEDTNNITTDSITLPTSSKGPSYAYRTVTFDDNGGSCSTDSLTSTNTTTYTFKNWKDSSGNTTYNAGTSYTPSKSITLIAQWTPSSNGYSAITLPTATRAEYNFNGWQDTSGNTYPAGTSYIPPSDEVTLTASWSGQTYQVKYNGNGHTKGSMSNSTHTIDVASNLSSNFYEKEYTLSFDTGHTDSSSLLPSEYIQLDYVESNSQQYVDTGHYQTSSSMKIETQFMITENHTYNALCGCEDTNSGPWSLTVLMNSANPFTLGIWSGSSPNGSNMGAIPVIENTIHTLSCETNNGTITYSCDENIGTLYTDSAFCESKSMYLFTINSAGTGTTNQASKMRIYYFKIYDNNELKRSFIPCKRVSDNVTGLYDLITKSFYRSGSGVDLIAGNEITSSGGTIETIDDIKVSYAFQGWYSNANGTGEAITQANNLTTAGNTYNVYAKWIQNSFTLPIPVRSGYNFLGWFDGSGNLITSNSTITSDLTLTAQWSEANANKIIIYTNNDWKKAIALIYKNNTWQEYNFNI